MIKNGGIIFYINLASPTLMAEGMLRYIDYDLDYKLYPDGHVVTLDEREHEQNKKRYHYSPDLQLALKKAAVHVLGLLDRREFPFQYDVVSAYYERFLKLSGE